MEPDYSNMTNDELEALIKQRVANAEKDGFFRRAHQVAAWAGAGKSKRFEYGSSVQGERDWGRFVIDAPSQNTSDVEVRAALGDGELSKVIDYDEPSYFTITVPNNYIIPGPWIDAINEIHPRLEAEEKHKEESATAKRYAEEREKLMRYLIF